MTVMIGLLSGLLLLKGANLSHKDRDYRTFSRSRQDKSDVTSEINEIAATQKAKISQHKEIASIKHTDLWNCPLVS